MDDNSSFSDSSSSDIVNAEFISSNDSFSAYEEIPCHGYNKLYKVKRYGRWMVLKGLKPEYATQTLYVEMLKKEFELGMQLDHPNIVKVFGKEHDAKIGACIVMEYIDGQTLSDFLKTNPPAHLRKKVVNELLNAMDYFHSKQIVHRDLKPSNILVTHNGNNIKIIDFGLSDADNYAVLKQPAGTAKYAAPEQLIATAPIDCRTDIYAFGKVLRRIYPHRYGHIVRKCTQQNPAKRYANDNAVADAIERNNQLHKTILFLLLALAILVPCGFFIFNINHLPASHPQTETTDTVDTTNAETDLPTLNLNDTIKPKIEKPQKTTEAETTKNYFSPSEKAIMDSLEKQLERIYITEIQLCIRNENYSRNIQEQILQKCKTTLEATVALYNIKSQRQSYELTKFAEICQDSLSAKYEQPLQQCESLTSGRQYVLRQKQEEIKTKQEVITDAVNYYAAHEFNLNLTDAKPDIQIDILAEEYPSEAQQAKTLVHELVPIFKNTYQLLANQNTVGEQIKVFETHFAQLFDNQHKTEQNLTNATDTIIYQYGFYYAINALHKQILSPNNEFKYSVSYHQKAPQIYISVNEENYKKSALRKNISAEERNKYIDNYPAGHEYASNEIRYKQHVVYTITTKQYIKVY